MTTDLRIPQQRPYRMVGVLIECNEREATTEFWVGAVSPYMLDGKMTTAGIMENMCQSCYVWRGEMQGLKASGNSDMQITEVQQLSIQRLPVFGDSLLTRLQVLENGDTYIRFQVECWVRKDMIASSIIVAKKQKQHLPQSVVVIGGGLSGLLTAVQLQQRGVRVTVLEQNTLPGGGLLNFYKNGLWWDTGMHCFDGLHRGSWCWNVLNSLDINIPIEQEHRVISHGSDDGEEYFREFLYPIFGDEHKLTYRKYTFAYENQILIGGSRVLLNQLVKTFKTLGGSLITKADVCSFDVGQDGRVCSVKTKDGSIYEADAFVSTIHIKQLMQMYPDSLFKKATLQRIHETPESIGNFQVFVKLKPRSIAYKRQSHYIVSDKVAIYCPSEQSQQEWCNKLIIMKWINFDELRQWEHGRDDKYYLWKENKAKELIAIAEKILPELRDSIDSYFTSTSLTYRDEFHTPEGANYGILDEILTIHTKVPNLFLSGQDCYPHGFANMMATSILTRDAVLDYLAHTYEKSRIPFL